MRHLMHWLGLVSLGVIIFCSQTSWAATVKRSIPTDQSAIRFETVRQAQPLNVSAKRIKGESWITLKTVVNYLGGSVYWHDVTHKVVIKGPSGRQAVLTLNRPKLVLERHRLIRLSHLPKMINGSVMVSAETMVEIWKHVGDRLASYDSSHRVFRVGDEPVNRQLSVDAKAANEKGTTAQSKSAAVSKNGKKDIIVVVDAGHGGKDPGAIGPSRLKEKTVVLEVARRLSKYLKQKGLKVVMTRSDDQYISLKNRANKANKLKADLFISIHANASRNRKANGSQVFIYNREASSRHAAEAAKLENQDANYLEIIKDDLRQSVHEESSINAAGLVSQQLGGLGLKVKRIERAPFYVLAKSHMPSILVETAFISNYAEEKKLRSREFCRKLAAGIHKGISQYYKEKNGK